MKSNNSLRVIVICAVFVSLLISGIQEVQAWIPAFPGAQGFGSTTVHGRGGKVLFVTHTGDDGPGSLREAAEDTEGRRIIVFRVSGVIHLKSPLNIKHPYCMIAGQSAPGDGICLTGAPLNIATHDVVIRYLRSRPGDNPNDYKPENRDGFSVANQRAVPYNVVLDHLSVSWAIDENLSTWYPCHDITFQWCIVSEALLNSLHPKGAHSKGLLVGDHGYNISIHHNLFAHNNRRNPLLKADTKSDIVNNIIYNWGEAAIHLSNYEQTDLPIFANIIANYFKAGPSTDADSWEVNIPSNIPVTSALYLEGNLGPHRLEDTGSEWLIANPDRQTDYSAENPMAGATVTTYSAEHAYEAFLEGAGAYLPRRDAVDTRIIENVRTGSGAIIDRVDETPGMPAYTSNTPPEDKDNDGMADSWERKNGLTVGIDDSAADWNGNGYSNIEEYLNFLVSGEEKLKTFPWYLFQNIPQQLLNEGT